MTFDTETWYHAAVTYDDNGAGTLDDSTVAFYLTAEGSYGSGLYQVGQETGAEDLDVLGATGFVLVGETFNPDDPDNGADNFNGYIDEVRYSNVVRNFSGAIPESGSLVVLGIALLGMRRRRA